MTQPDVVAGFDGSECSLHAARWAAAEAEQRGAGLLLVHAAPAVAHTNPAALLSAAEGTLRSDHPDLPIGTLLAGATAVASLLDIAAGALLTVVGSWGTGRAPGTPLGSVAFSVASTSRTPVVVVRPQHGRSARRPVAVAVDGRTAPRAALDFAFAAADIRNVRLLVVHVRHDAAIDGAFPYQVVRGPVLSAGVHMVPEPAGTQEDRAALVWRLLPWQRRYPGVHVTPSVLFGSPTATLLDFSRRSDLLVIGDAGRGVNSGMFLGATGQALLQRSACPVVVARSGGPGG